MPEEPVTPPIVAPEQPPVAQTVNPVQPAALPLTPQTWPGAFGVYKFSKAAMLLNLGTFIGLALINMLASSTQNIPKAGEIVSLVATTFATAAFTVALLASIRGKKVSLNDSFSKTPKFFFNLFLLNILVGLALVLSLILFIIPFFFLAPRLALATYFLIDKDMNAIDAFKASLDATKGNSGKVWGIIGVFVLMALPVITIVGIPVSIYLIFMYSASTVVLYEFILKTAPAPAAVAPAAPALPVV